MQEAKNEELDLAREEIQMLKFELVQKEVELSEGSPKEARKKD